MKSLLLLCALTLVGCSTVNSTLKTLNPATPVNPGRAALVTYTWNV